MNIYDRLKMYAPTPHQVAQGAFNSSTVTPPAVPKTDVFALLDRSSNARGYVDGPHERPYRNGQYGMGLNGLGHAPVQFMVPLPRIGTQSTGLRGLRGLGDTALAPGVTFKNDDAFNDFVHGVDLRDGGSWGGVPQGLISAFQDAMANAANSGPAGSAASDAIQGKAKGIAASIDSYQRFGIGGRSVSQDQLYRGAMKQLKALIMSAPKTLNAAVAADNAAAAAAPAIGAGSSGGGGGGVDYGSGGGGGYGGGGSRTGTGRGAATASGTSKLPFILGGGLLLAGGLFYFWRKRK